MKQTKETLAKLEAIRQTARDGRPRALYRVRAEKPGQAPSYKIVLAGSLARPANSALVFITSHQERRLSW